MAGFWISLAILVAGIATGLAFALGRGLQLYRRVKRTNAAFAGRVDSITASSASIEGHLAAAEASGRRLGAARERLEASRARLDVQLAALREARAQLRRVLWFVPGV